MIAVLIRPHWRGGPMYETRFATAYPLLEVPVVLAPSLASARAWVPRGLTLRWSVPAPTDEARVEELWAPDGSPAQV